MVAFPSCGTFLCASSRGASGTASVSSAVCFARHSSIFVCHRCVTERGFSMNLPTLITLGGVCHFGILTASALTPKVLNWKTELQHLHPLFRHVVWTHGAF